MFHVCVMSLFHFRRRRHRKSR